ncbi:hypothetical protein PMI42_02134 [Bradyrhizobium sp. YR681]|uniref:hypothetical protein n=1 Tax=Bradyrhizobium sp. YR681 TaxID=1144344 RepID=UPI0002710523|nr:hypothetical protein [Bradyrhizobium sp. YR681]EJN14287.1 hypothetical protein PMI42_02134 [Bradyrhizobium sp. YR681]
MRHTISTIMMSLVTAQSALAADICTTSQTPDSLRWVQYYLSRPQDAPGCAMRVENGMLIAVPPVSNPALSCPDMFAWKLFAESVTAQFWKNWAADQETWPGNGLSSDPGRPLPLCSTGQAAQNCCNPGAATNPGYDDPTYKAKYCPFFPADHTNIQATLKLGVPPSKAHTLGMASRPAFRDALKAEAVLANQILDAPDPTKGRRIRQSMAEIVFRNKPFFDFVFRNDLYNTEGITKIYANNANNMKSGAPYRTATQGGPLSEITFPANALMIKSDWLARERAEAMGLREDPQNPYVKMEILTPVLDDNGSILLPGEHWLVAIHFSSKDIPNWVWTTFEHVNNPGRCDYTGCNDSYGYTSPDQVGAGQARNFTRPHQMCDGLLLPSYVLDPGGSYPGGARQPALARVFDGLGIGIADNATLQPKPSDRSWLSYRLKGTQVDFTDSMGRPTHLGNSVTEAGFVTSSSCMTCHSRASTNAAGTVPLPLGVFENGLTESGYLPSATGTPNPAWFNKSGQPPTQLALQTDFVWGFLFANPIAPPALVAAAPPPAGAAAAAISPAARLNLLRSARERILEQR